MYKNLEQMGYKVGLNQCGTIGLAQTQDRMIAIRRRMTYSIPTGLACELLSPNEIKRMHPYLNVDDIQGGVFISEDAVVDPSAICSALIDLAKKNGVNYRENCKIEKVLTEKDKVVGVETDAGIVDCEYFINCAGMWARDLGLKCTKPVRIPSYPAKHFYAVTNGLNVNTSGKMLPTIRDFDSCSYGRQYNNEMLIGWFETDAQVAFENREMPQDWTKGMGESFIDYDSMWEKTVHRIPKLVDLPAPFITNIPGIHLILFLLQPSSFLLITKTIF